MLHAERVIGKSPPLMHRLTVKIPSATVHQHSRRCSANQMRFTFLSMPIEIDPGQIMSQH